MPQVRPVPLTIYNWQGRVDNRIGNGLLCFVLFGAMPKSERPVYKNEKNDTKILIQKFKNRDGLVTTLPTS